MGKVMVIDIAKCHGCYDCQIACKDEHVDNDWSPYAKPQPDTGHFWLKLEEMERGTTPKVKVTYIPVLCMHCDNASCMSACKVKAIYKRPDGLVIIDPEKCNGCRECVAACPYHAIYFNDKLNIAQKCTGCAHLLDGKDPLISTPRCVDVCPFDAIIFGDEKDLKSMIEKAEVLKPECGAKPRVYYLNLPKPFIAGAVYDPDVDECVEGAKVTVTDPETGETYETVTDEFGDFWLNNLRWNRKYTVKVEKEGYYTWTLDDVRTEKDVNLGDIPLLRKT
ncbi:MAG: carboxypeptidase regulatory-like domain-containing protein [Candidatus Nezhaarchaeota archaeon]|nr:carboxypeptidase regulatory-like domain-containing protein [Candidatus Nezhaarchaeota archaeon]